LAYPDWSYRDNGGDRLFMWINYPNANAGANANYTAFPDRSS